MKKVKINTIEDANELFQSQAINWSYLCSYEQELSESFMREFHDKIDWEMISACQELSESFIRDFSSQLNWNRICSYQVLSENFIEEFQHKVLWGSICSDQKLSRDFLIKNIDNVYLFYLLMNEQISEDVKEEIKLIKKLTNSEEKNNDK